MTEETTTPEALPVQAVPEDQTTALSPADGFRAMIDSAIAKGDPDMVRELIQLWRDQEKHEAEKAYHRDFARFKAEAPPTVWKNKLVHFKTSKGVTRYRHVTLDHAENVFTPILSKYGFSHDWDQSQDEKGKITITCTLTHELGFSKSAQFVCMPDDSGNKNQIQQASSAITYGRRITFFGLLGIAGHEDDDGEAAGRRPSDADEQATINEQQLATLRDLVRETESDTARYLTTLATATGVPPIESLDKIPAALFGNAVAFLHKKKQRMAAEDGSDD